jgi:hypothetical protein
MGDIYKLEPRDRAPDGQVAGAAKAAACPICGKPAQPKARPFCSTRCAHLDLGRWLTGTYRVPTEEAPEAADTGREEDKPG